MPEKVGPNAGPNDTTQIHVPITNPRFSRGWIASAVFIKIGIIMLVPNACIILDINSNGNDAEKNAHMVPIKNKVTAPINNLFVVKVFKSVH